MGTARKLWTAYRLRWQRRRLLLRAVRRRRQLAPVRDRTTAIAPGAILCFCTLRNEAVRLPWWLDHYRRLGVTHFLIVDNDSTDGSAALLSDQPDVSLWHTGAGYKQSRFGVDWLTWLMIRHGHGHWCLTVDADELFIYPHHDTRPLPALTGWLERSGRDSLSAMMLDLYPRGPVASQDYAAGTDPLAAIPWFDRGNYMIRRQEPMGQLWIQGGPRARVFFSADPRRAPTMSKTPLVRWNRRYAYVTSTHALLPRRLNRVYDESGGELTSGILLHTKFLNTIVGKSVEEKRRQQHFENSTLYQSYYDSLIANPDLWCAQSSRFEGWRQLEAMGLMSRGGWL